MNQELIGGALAIPKTGRAPFDWHLWRGLPALVVFVGLVMATVAVHEFAHTLGFMAGGLSLAQIATDYVGPEGSATPMAAVAAPWETIGHFAGGLSSTALLGVVYWAAFRTRRRLFWPWGFLGAIVALFIGVEFSAGLLEGGIFTWYIEHQPQVGLIRLSAAGICVGLHGLLIWRTRSERAFPTPPLANDPA